MKRARIFPVLASLLMTLATIVRAQRPEQKAPDHGLGGTSWQLVQFQGMDDTTLTPADKSNYTLEFDPDGNVSVRIDCNRGHGTWKSPGPNQLTFGPLALTRAMCLPAPLNNRLPRDFDYVRSYVMKNGHLFLALMADGGIYEFEPLAETAETTGLTGLPATFVGTWPCADCPGIQYQVNLLSDHTFTSRTKYLERQNEFTDHGSWRLTENGKTLILQGAHGAPEQYAVRDDTLRKLDADGHEIQSQFNYDLKRAATSADGESQGKPTGAVALEETHWKLVKLGGSPINATSEQQQPHLILTAESHRVSGSGGCNRLVGSYDLNGEQLAFDKMALTMMACISGMETEKAFQDALAQVRTWKIEGQQLKLMDANGHELALFEAQQ